MGRAKLVYISESYTRYLVKHCHSYSGKEAAGAMRRPYILLPDKINGHSYCIPLSSPKRSDYLVKEDGSLEARNDLITHVRITRPHEQTGKPEVLGSAVISKMIPVPESEIIECEIGKMGCSKAHRRLLHMELKGVEEKFESICEKAAITYSMMERGGKYESLRVKMKCDILEFESAERACLKYSDYLQRGLSEDEILALVSHLPDLVFEDKSKGDKSVSMLGALKTTAGDSSEKQQEQGIAGGVAPHEPKSRPKSRPKLEEMQYSTKRENSENVKLVNVSDYYVKYLAKSLNWMGYLTTHSAGRMFLLFPHLLNGHVYCIPLSSPKPSDYYTNLSGKRCVKSDSLHVLRLVHEHASISWDKLKGTLRTVKMMPVPMSEIIPYDPESETRPNYRGLLEIQRRCIESKFHSVIECTVNLYNMKVGAIPPSDRFMSVEKRFAALDFRAAEYYCTKYKECLEKGIPRENILETVISETDGGHKGESSSHRDEQPGCSSWGVSPGRYSEDKYSRRDSADGGRKRKYRDEHHSEYDEPTSVRKRLSDSCGETSYSRSSQSRSYSGKGKGLGKGRIRRTLTR